MIALMLLATVPAAIPANINRIEVLVEQSSTPKAAADTRGARPGFDPTTWCFSDKHLCLKLAREDPSQPITLDVFDGSLALADRAVHHLKLFKLAPDPNDDSSWSIWPQAVVMKTVPNDPDEPLLVGILNHSSTMYSGGGAQANSVTLYQLTASAVSGGPGHQFTNTQDLLTVPLSSNIMIRACFTEKDYRERRGVCHDEYSYEATIGVDPDDAHPLPRLTYKAIATAMPGSTRRSADMSGTRLSRKDLEPAEDPDCTFSRAIVYNPITERYEFDRPGPECSDYTVP